MSYEPADTELKQLTGRWIAQWNEPSPDERRQLISRASGSIAGSGLEVLTFGPDGRVRTDHEFVA
jgi:hypothetical protein